MSLLESLFDLLKDVEVSEKDELVDGFIMQPSSKYYKIFHEKNEICSVNFLEKDSGISEDMKIAQDNPNQYKVVLNEIKDEEKTKNYIKKLTFLGFDKIEKN